MSTNKLTTSKLNTGGGASRGGPVCCGSVRWAKSRDAGGGRCDGERRRWPAWSALPFLPRAIPDGNPHRRGSREEVQRMMLLYQVSRVSSERRGIQL
jgi:hypothetical protein